MPPSWVQLCMLWARRYQWVFFGEVGLMWWWLMWSSWLLTGRQMNIVSNLVMWRRAGRKILRQRLLPRRSCERSTSCMVMKYALRGYLSKLLRYDSQPRLPPVRLQPSIPKHNNCKHRMHVYSSHLTCKRKISQLPMIVP
jgi:hypothetical protein